MALAYLSVLSRAVFIESNCGYGSLALFAAIFPSGTLITKQSLSKCDLEHISTAIFNLWSKVNNLKIWSKLK